MIHLTAAELFKFSGKHRSREWPLGEQIKREGWDPELPVALTMREGATTVLEDGNKRVSYLARNGAGEMLVPVILTNLPPDAAADTKAPTLAAAIIASGYTLTPRESQIAAYFFKSGQKAQREKKKPPK